MEDAEVESAFSPRRQIYCARSPAPQQDEGGQFAHKCFWELFLQPLAYSLHFNITVSHKAHDGSLARPPDLLRPYCGGESQGCEPWS